MLALILGVRTKEQSELHRQTGTLHLLAVSGFHIGLLFLLASRLFRRGPLKVCCASLLLWFYVFFLGAQPGAVRAALMTQIYLLSLPLGRPSSGFNSVSAAGVLMLLYNPWSLFDVGWQLSMSAALFLTAASKLWGRSWSTAAALSFLVWLVTAPIAAHSFEEIPLAGLFINAAAVPLFALIFPLALLLSLPALAAVPGGSQIALAAEPLIVVWEELSLYAAGLLPWSVGYTRPLQALALFIFSAAVMNASGFSKTRSAAGSILLPAALYLL